MQVHQVVIRAQGNMIIVLYMDALGNRYNMVLDAAGLPGVTDLVAACQSRLPPDTENPAKGEIQQEISELENRIKQLKQSIGAAVAAPVPD